MAPQQPGMPSIVDLYDRLASAPDERARAKIIAEAFEALEERYPHIQDLITRRHLSETELRLIKEIEKVRADLSREIEQVRADLSKDIEKVRADLSVRIEQVRSEVIRWSFLFWVSQFAAILLILWRIWPR